MRILHKKENNKFRNNKVIRKSTLKKTACFAMACFVLFYTPGSTAWAAPEPFPFEEYDGEDGSVVIRDIGEIYYLKDLFDEGLVLDESYTYQGYRQTSTRNELEREQDVRVTVSVPDGLITDFENQYFHELNMYETNESDLYKETITYEGYNNSNSNSVSYSIGNDFSISVHTPKGENCNTIEEAIEKEADSNMSWYTDDYFGAGNKIEKPAEKYYENGCTIVKVHALWETDKETHETFPDVDGFEKETIEEFYYFIY